MNAYNPNRIAHITSTLLHPFVIPLYVVLTLLCAGSVFSYFPFNIKAYLVWVVVLYTIIIPVLAMLLLHSTGRISSYRVGVRSERIRPLVIGAVCYVLCAVTIAKIPSAMLIRMFMISAACCEVMCLVVSLRWKISLHMTALGAVAAILLVLIMAGMGNLTAALITALLCAGALAAARLQLGCHNPLQIAAGFFGGFVLTFVTLLMQIQLV